MIQTCSEDYWKYMQALKPKEAPCGRTFDGLTNLTYCPHNPLPPRMTHEELEKFYHTVLGIE